MEDTTPIGHPPRRASQEDTPKMKMEYDNRTPVSSGSQKAQAFTIRNIIATDIENQHEPAQRVPSIDHYDNTDDLPMDNEEYRKGRSRILFSREQLTRLREVFQRTQYPGIQERLRLAEELSMTHKSVKQWFQNARSKMKKRGTDHVTGFYANKMAAKNVASPDSWRLSDQQTISNTDQQESTATPRGSDELKSIAKGRVSLASPLLDRDHVEHTRIPSPISSDDMDSSIESSRTSYTGLPSPHNSSFHEMQMVSLPADHPFCNLGNPGFVWPDLPQTHAEACDHEHESSEQCQGQTHDDLLAEYLRGGKKETKVQRGSTDRKRKAKSPTDRYGQKTSKRKAMEIPAKIESVSQDEDHPLDLSIKKEKQACEKTSPHSDLRMPGFPLIHPLAFVHPYYTLQFCRSGYAPVKFDLSHDE